MGLDMFDLVDHATRFLSHSSASPTWADNPSYNYHSRRRLLLMSGIDAVGHKAPDDDSGQPHRHKSCPMRGELLLLGELAALRLWDVEMWLHGQAQKLQNVTVRHWFLALKSKLTKDWVACRVACNQAQQPALSSTASSFPFLRHAMPQANVNSI